MSEVVSLPGRRRLSDLYVRGKDVEIDDGNGDPVAVWIQKISPLEDKQSMDQANAVRAKLMAAKFGPDEDELRLAMSSEAEMGGVFSDRDGMIDYIHSQDIHQVRMTIEAELADDEEWSKNGYLEGLRVAWNGDGEGNEGLKNVYALDPENVEANAILAEIKRYIAHVEGKLERERRKIRREEDRTTDKELRRRVVDQLIENEADQVWYGEFRKRQLFYSVREPSDHNQRYFENIFDIDRLDAKVVTRLMTEFDDVNVSREEGKD